MKKLILMLALLLALTGCGQKAEAPAAEDRNPTAAELGREETTELVFTVEGEAEVIPATLYVGQGYSIYIPDEGWRLEQHVDDGIPEETWESVLNDDVELTVAHYAGKTLTEARDAFVRDKDYMFEDLMGGELGDPLTGADEDGDCLSFMMAEGADTVYVIYWKYPAEAAEGFGARLGVMADTFQAME